MPGLSFGNVVLLSGPIASGKTTLCRLLALRCGFYVVSTRELLAPLTGDRRTLQSAGAALDASTTGRWVRDGLVRLRVGVSAELTFVVDSVRTHDQVKWVRETFGASVKHIHLTASSGVLSARYLSRLEGLSYEEVVSDPVERKVGLLASSADLVVDTESLGVDSVLERVVEYLAL